MNQEKIMKARMVTAIIISVVLAIVMLVFIGLYADSTHKIQETYQTQYAKCIKLASDELGTYLERKTDYNIHYSMLVSDIGSARTLAFLIDNFTAHQKTINEFQYALVKYPEQMKSKLKAVHTALVHLTENLDKGYDELDKITNGINKLGK